MKLSVLIVIVLCGVLYITCCSKNGSVTVLVNRRLVYDIYELSQHNDKTKHDRCDEQTTYMVEERQCFKNEDIFKSCRLSMTQNETRRPIVHVSSNKEIMVFDLDMQQQINGTSVCKIESLYVYRGVEKFFQINHTGFLLSTNGTLKINKTALAYNVQEYAGEMYQMTVSCSQAVLIENKDNCFFFIAWGTSNVTEPKFNCTVPGTLYDHSANDGPHTTITTFTEPNENTPAGAVAVTDKLTNQKILEVGSPLFFGVIATGGGIIAVLALCSMCCICTTVILKKSRSRVSAVRSSTMERRCSITVKQSEAKNEKNLELRIYELQDEVMKSQLYGCNCLESNPSYRETGALCTMSNSQTESLECEYAVIPDHYNPVYSNKSGMEVGEPVYQEILPQVSFKFDTKSSISKLGLDTSSPITAQNEFYETSFHCQHQSGKGCESTGEMGSTGAARPMQHTQQPNQHDSYCTVIMNSQ